MELPKENIAIVTFEPNMTATRREARVLKMAVKYDIERNFANYEEVMVILIFFNWESL